MNLRTLSLLLLLLSASAAPHARAQTAPDIPTGAPQARPGETDDQKAARLLAEMVKALGGDAWLNKRTESIEGQRSTFFHGAPTGLLIRYLELIRFPGAGAPPAERIDFVTDRSQLLAAGSHVDLVHLWTAEQGLEYTYKGMTKLPADQVQDYLRRRRHSIEEVMRTWVKQPGVLLVYEGQGQRDRHIVEKVAILSAQNDAVTLELDQTTHLPLQRSFEWRDEKFNDKDIDEEVYGDWRMYDGIMSPLNVSRYKNGDLSDENFYKKIHFNQPEDASLFDPDHVQLKK